MKRKSVQFRQVCWIFAFSLVCSSCASANDDRTPTFSVSLAVLLVDPSPYVAKEVAVVGYADVGFNFILYQSKAHADFTDSSSAVILRGAESAAPLCSNQNIRVVGTLGWTNDRVLYIEVRAIYDFDSVKSIAELCWQE